MSGPVTRMSGASGSAPTSEVTTPAAQEASHEFAALTVPGDVVASALMELSSFLRKMQEGQRSIQRAHEQARVDQEKNEAQAMHEKADALRSSAVLSGVAIGASAVFVGADAGWGTGAQNHTGQVLEGGAKVCDGTSSLFGRIGDANAADHQADASNARAISDQEQSRAEDAKDRSKDLADLASKALEAVRAVLQAQQTARMAIASRV